MRLNSITGGYRGGSSQGKVCMRSNSITGGYRGGSSQGKVL